MADGATEKIITLRSSDGVEFVVPKKVAMMIQMIRHAIEDDSAHNPIIPIPNVNSEILSLMLEYCVKHAPETKVAEDGAAVSTTAKLSDDKEQELEAWDKDFVDVDGDMLYHILTAAHLLSIDGLVDLVIKKVADVIHTKPLDKARRFLNIESGFTPEEEEEMHRRYPWAFDH